MTRSALAAAAALLLRTAACAAFDDALTRLKNAPEPADRISACEALAKPPLRGPKAYEALSAAMTDDLSDQVRLAAAVAATTYGEGRTLTDIDAFLKAERGAHVRRALIVALSSATAQYASPDATRIIAVALAEDPDAGVRLAAAQALLWRGDALAVGAVRQAALKDADLRVREAAKEADKVLSRPPKPPPKPKVKPPKTDAVMGKDPCFPPWGWCICSGVISLKPKCLTRDECRGTQSEMRSYGLVCRWDGVAENE